MKVVLFDEEHEKDLEKEINCFLAELDDEQLVDIKFSVAASCDAEGEQVYCFSAMVLYRS
ncbi:sporulation protein Cse60 [Metabacillus sp. 84]|uniref:sporulation protein Cse60 n=1 Tax=unclassified Metabacillus TaxID=2675274 RepID=UPI003CEE98CF